MCDDVLTKVDYATMGFSLKGRASLLSHRIIEYLARAFVDLKCKNNKGECLLRKILYKYLPKEMIDNPKSDSQTPLEKCLKGDLKYLIEKYLDEKRLDSEIFNIQEVIHFKVRPFFRKRC